MQKIRPSEQKRNQIKAVLEAGMLEALENLQRLGQETIWQESLEAEVDEHLGHAWYRRANNDGRGHRNGYYRRQLTVPGSALKVSVPRMRNTREKFTSRLLKAVARLAERVRRVALEAYVRNLSVRDIEQTFVTDDGHPVLSRSAMSRLATRLYDEYVAFSQRDLSELDAVYVFVDGVYEAVRRFTNGQALLCGWAICADGTKQLLHLAPVQSESANAWESFFEDMPRRGLRQPLLVISD